MTAHDTSSKINMQKRLAKRPADADAPDTMSDPASATWWPSAELLATVSHEMRSPLAAIKGYAATLLRHERRLAKEERYEFLRAIGEASDRLTVIIDQLFAISQFEAGAVRLERDAVDLGRLARQALLHVAERVAQSAPGKYTFSLRVFDATGAPTVTPPLVDGDPRLLRELLDKLLENAILYSPQGGAIDVVARPVVDDESAEDGAATMPRREMLELSVCDRGLGIPDEHLRRVFDRFHRVDTSLTRVTPGLGLGLTMCERIVELHEGAIWAESEGDIGSVFYVRLPLAQVEAAQDVVRDTPVDRADQP
jgi:signal transduction histidine kinase